jgi:hypothetical protein
MVWMSVLLTLARMAVTASIKHWGLFVNVQVVLWVLLVKRTLMNAHPIPADSVQPARTLLAIFCAPVLLAIRANCAIKTSTNASLARV